MEKDAQIVEVRDGSYLGSNLPVTQQDFDALSSQRAMLQDFVSKQLRKGVDYGVIPGVKKPSLFKPGAEKLARLFGLGITMKLDAKEVDRRDNFAMFDYKAIITHLKSGQVIAECIGSCNSQEEKYRTRRKYKTVNGKRVLEAEIPTPVCDILNTLQKMSQKRAFVGAVILSVGASDFFTQDIDEPGDAENINVNAKEANKDNEAPKVKAASSIQESEAPT